VLISDSPAKCFPILFLQTQRVFDVFIQKKKKIKHILNQTHLIQLISLLVTNTDPQISVYGKKKKNNTQGYEDKQVNRLLLT